MKGSAGMGIKELSLELAAVSLIADEAKKAKDRLRAALQTEMDAIGADRVKAEYGDDVIAYVTTTKPKFKWVIKSDKPYLMTKFHSDGKETLKNAFQSGQLEFKKIWELE